MSSQFDAVQGDEISFTELFWILVENKVAVLVVTVAVTSLAAVYALVAPSVYRATANLLPPQAASVQMLNIEDLYSITPSEVYQQLYNNLHSVALQRRFFEQNKLRDSLIDKVAIDGGITAGRVEQQVFERFQKRIRVNLSQEGEDPRRVQVAIEWSNAEEAARLVNAYIDMACESTADQLVKDVRQVFDSRLDYLEGVVASKKVLGRQKRLDLIEQLSEAEKIARALGWERPQFGNGAPGERVINVTLLTDSSNLLYFRGADSLAAEADVLKQRVSDDAFILGLRDAQESVYRLRSMRDDFMVKVGGLGVAVVDQPAFEPLQRVRPNRRQVVILGVMIGLSLGIIFALVRHSISRRQVSFR